MSDGELPSLVEGQHLFEKKGPAKGKRGIEPSYVTLKLRVQRVSRA
jgi:hypothetical protein